MEKYFGNAYRGDPGVPHSGSDRFENIWVGSALFSVLTYFNPYMWQLSNQYNWHDKAMLYEQYHWKQARKKNQPYDGTKPGTRPTVNITTTTGLVTFLSPFLFHFLQTLSYLYFGCKPGYN
ncbi:hypothetical protein CR513_22800 [Mucuna pruriens]|uniref:Uncharacterized protein n=1 Tax=Mucuna pruriens TaxID=157652 RepID=A0A371GW58_MUCPR|nr:hypothetical protein CR513_22800 [Mucuna pruriens]